MFRAGVHYDECVHQCVSPWSGWLGGPPFPLLFLYLLVVVVEIAEM